MVTRVVVGTRIRLDEKRADLAARPLWVQDLDTLTLYGGSIGPWLPLPPSPGQGCIWMLPWTAP